MDKKDEKLGMSYGKARHQLNRVIIFDLVKKLNLDTCYRCSNKIDKLEDLSIEHKKAWLNSNNPKELYFDTNNIAFSHMNCNREAADHSNKDYCKEESFRKIMSKVSSKISDNVVLNVRKDLENGLSLKATANKYNISRSAVIHFRDFSRRKFVEG